MCIRDSPGPPPPNQPKVKAAKLVGGSSKAAAKAAAAKQASASSTDDSRMAELSPVGAGGKGTGGRTSHQAAEDDLWSEL